MISMLIQSYPNDIGKIKKNWFSFLKVDSNLETGKLYQIVHKKIMENPTDDKVQLDKHDLFPIRDK